MLALITFLLAALAMSVSGISIPSNNTTSSRPANATMQKDAPQTAQNCDLLTFNYDSCSCFAGLRDGTYGVDRSLMIDAIIFACDEFTGGIGDPVSVYGLGEGLTRGKRRREKLDSSLCCCIHPLLPTLTLEPSLTPLHPPLSNISPRHCLPAHVSQTPTNSPSLLECTYDYLYPATHDDEEGHIKVMLKVKNDNHDCNGPIPVGWGWCWDDLHKPLDSCDTAAVNGKYGGIMLHKCVNWVLDPNPNVNYPYTGLIE